MTTIEHPVEHLSTLPGLDEKITRRTIHTDLPTTFAQERLWLLDRLEIGGAAYNTLAAYRITGKINLPALQKSLAELVKRHEILRTTFAVKAQHPVQVVAPSLTMDLPLVLEMLGKSEADRLEIIQETLTSEANTVFDIEFGPLFYAKLIRFADDDALFVINTHQSIFDQHSLNIFSQELAELYNAYSSEGKFNLPELPFQYADYAQWQRGWMQGEVESELLHYWKTQLADASYVLELPTDRPRPTVLSFAGTTYDFSLSADLTRSLKDFCQEVGASLPDVLLAAFKTLIFRYTNREDILIGASVMNRLQTGTDALIGNFMNLLVLRTQFTGDMLFTDLLQQVQQVTEAAQAHQAYPFEKLLDELKPERDISRPPLVQITFDYFDKPQPFELQGLKLAVMPTLRTTSRYDFSLVTWEENGILHGQIEYSTDLFDASTIERMATHWEILLRGAIETPYQAIALLPLLTEAERQQVLVDWNNTRRDDLRMAHLHQIFEEQAAKTPDRIATSYQDQQMTYAELNRRANRLAHFLMEKGVGADVVIAILAERNIEYQIAMLAILKAGGAFLPLNTRQPVDRHAQILVQCEAPVVLGSKTYLPILQEAAVMVSDAPQIFLIDELLQKQEYSEENPPLKISLDNLAYMMFTSGSTGQPKGVMVEHRGMINHNYAKISDLGMTQNDILAQNGPQSFDIMVWQFLAPLIIGGRVHIFEDDIAHNPMRLLDEIEKVGITVLQIVPALLNIMIQEAETRGENRPQLDKLRWVVPTGDALPTEMCRQWLRVYPQIPLLNTYGSTECSDDQCHYPVTEIPSSDYRLPIMTIGRPIFNMQIYVLDKWLQPAPIGVIGELYVGGIGVGRGYLKDAEKTTKAFIPDPFTTNRVGAKLYKTGDQGRYMPDGTIEFLGRVDHMVKVRGFRIELGEIEAVIGQHPAIKQNVVVVHDEGNTKMLVAYVVSDSATPPSAAELRDFVGAKLPDYMVPTIFVTLDAMPLSNNGKIDRKALPKPDVSKTWEDNYLAPRNAVEEDLVRVWAEVIGLPRVGIRDNFFELGGHSLLAIRIFSHIDKKYGKQLPLGTLFRAPTIEQLALILQGEGDADLWSPLVTIQGNGNRPPFFCVGGGILHMHNISHHLGNKQPFYALQTETIEGDELLEADMSLIATRMLEEVKKVQPEGPYYLAGCYGSGMVALEMGRQLQEAEEGVAAMVMFNTVPGQKHRPLWLRILRKFRGLLKNNPITYIRRTWEDIDWLHVQEYFMEIIWKVAYKFYKTIGRPMPRFLRTGTYAELLLKRAASTYKPSGTFQGDVALFLTSTIWTFSYDDLVRRWSVLADGQLSVHDMPGDPCTMFTEPNVYVVGQELKTVLKEKQAKAHLDK